MMTPVVRNFPDGARRRPGAGGLVFLAIPMLPRFADAAMTPAVMATARQMLLVLLPLALLGTMLWLPDGSVGGAARRSFGASLQALGCSRAMRMLCGSLLLASMASGMCAACYFFYLGTYLGIADSFASIGFTTYLVAMLSGLASPRLIARIGKRANLAISWGSSVVALVVMAMIPRGRGAAIAVIVLFAVTSVGIACGDVAVPVMVADAAGDDEESTGSNQLGNFTGATVLCRKVGVAIGGGAAFVLLASFGFDPKAANGARAMGGFDLTLFVVPGLLYLSAAVAAMRVPEAKRGGWASLQYPA